MRLRFGRLLKNILSMVSLRGAEFLIGLVLLPYLVRVLGVDRFGALVFMQGVVRYGTVLVEYGFNLTGPRNVAQAFQGGDSPCLLQYHYLQTADFFIYNGSGRRSGHRGRQHGRSL